MKKTKTSICSTFCAFPFLISLLALFLQTEEYNASKIYTVSCKFEKFFRVYLKLNLVLINFAYLFILVISFLFFADFTYAKKKFNIFYLKG